MEDDYSKREIDAFMQEIKDTLLRIEIQTSKTNGRVSKLEVWRGFITGGMALISILLLPILFIVLSNYFK